MAILEWRKEDTVAVITLTNGENRHNPEFVAAFLGALDEIEKEYILAALELNRGNQTRTAVQLRIGSATLYRKLKSYGLIAGTRAIRKALADGARS